MQTKTDPRGERKTRRRDTPDALPTWRNTRPRGNQPIDRGDLERSVERFKALLGR